MVHNTVFGRFNWSKDQWDFKQYKIRIHRKNGKYAVTREYWDGDSYSQQGLSLPDAVKKYQYWIEENKTDNIRKLNENVYRKGMCQNETNV